MPAPPAPAPRQAPAPGRTDHVRASLLVRVPQADAFRLFTERIDAWWKRGMRFRHGGATSGFIHLEPCLGGRLFEAYDAAAGGERVVEVGRVLAWEPPRRLVFSWRNAAFKPGQTTTVEVDFTATAGGTQVHLLHRGWDGIPEDHPVRHGEPVGAFLRTMGLWWGEQLSSLRQLAQAPALGSPPPLR